MELDQYLSGKYLPFLTWRLPSMFTFCIEVLSWAVLNWSVFKAKLGMCNSDVLQNLLIKHTFSKYEWIIREFITNVSSAYLHV